MYVGTSEYAGIPHIAQQPHLESTMKFFVAATLLASASAFTAPSKASVQSALGAKVSVVEHVPNLH